MKDSSPPGDDQEGGLWVLVPLAFVLISAVLTLFECPRLPGEGPRGEPVKPATFDPAGDPGRP